MDSKEDSHQHPYFSSLFVFLCGVAVIHYVFSIAYTYVYYPTIWKNVIEGYMEVFLFLLSAIYLLCIFPSILIIVSSILMLTLHTIN